MWSAEPTSLPKSLYTCDTLVYLRLSNKVFVDVSSPVCLPSLKRLHLVFVVYKDEDSVVRLLSSCPILEYLYVVHTSTNSCSIENKPRLGKAVIYYYRYPDDKFMKSLSLVRYLEIFLGNETVAYCHGINFSELIECKICLII
ncbi:unnamed protein product [Arabidopsis halleri]